MNILRILFEGWLKVLHQPFSRRNGYRFRIGMAASFFGEEIPDGTGQVSGRLEDGVFLRRGAIRQCR